MEEGGGGVVGCGWKLVWSLGEKWRREGGGITDA